ncbi:MAG TPA: EAL domain-containing protein [Alphaproteobacteria bacterium]
MSYQSRSKRQIFAPGEVIIRQGDPGDCAYLIEDGLVEIYVTRLDGSEQILGKRGTGSIVGEMAVVDSKPRTASIRAATPCTILTINRDDFDRRLNSADPVIKLIMHVILTRYRSLLAGEGPEGSSAQEAEKIGGVSDRAFETIRITHDFKEAIMGYQLRLHYQPIVDIQSGKVAGFEALMRWHHPIKGIISPAVFIPIAEDSGLIVHASRWALRESVYMLNRLAQEHGLPNDWFMSLNFTGLDLAAEDFADNIADTLQSTEVAPSRIKLEITERMLIDDPEGAIKTLDRCKETGLTVALDDFGTGYSSLSYLHKFPIDTMKIDRSFVVNMLSDQGSMTLVKAIIALAKGLEMNIVAEGVEQQGESDALKALGCDMIQGYLYAKPMAETELVLWLKNRANN